MSKTRITENGDALMKNKFHPVKVTLSDKIPTKIKFLKALKISGLTEETIVEAKLFLLLKLKDVRLSPRKKWTGRGFSKKSFNISFIDDPVEMFEPSKAEVENFIDRQSILFDVNIWRYRNYNIGDQIAQMTGEIYEAVRKHWRRRG